MNKKPIIKKIEESQLKKNVPNFRVGDTVRVHTRIIEGDKERVQIFQGTVIARKGAGASETFTVHRVAYGEGMERVFPLHSPRIAKIEITKEGQVRRSKLNYLRGTSGKASKVKGRFGSARSDEAAAAAEAAAEEKRGEEAESASEEATEEESEPQAVKKS